MSTQREQLGIKNEQKRRCNRERRTTFHKLASATASERGVAAWNEQTTPQMVVNK